MKNCFDGYLTPECATCPFWCNGEDMTKGIGCNIPFPIDHCDAFNKMYEEENKGGA